MHPSTTLSRARVTRGPFDSATLRLFDPWTLGPELRERRQIAETLSEARDRISRMVLLDEVVLYPGRRRGGKNRRKIHTSRPNRDEGFLRDRFVERGRRALHLVLQ